jgi:HEAT repeat protein
VIIRNEWRSFQARRVRLFLFFFAIAAGLSSAVHSQDLTRITENLRTGNVEEKREALFQIRNLRSAEASRLAVAALRDKSPMVRATAASSVIFLPPAEAAAALLPLLNDKDEFVRREAAFALGEVGEPSTASQLLNTLTRDKSDEARTAAAVALGKVGNPVAVEPLLRIFGPPPTEDNEMIRRAAARSIGQIAQIMRSGKVAVLTPQNFLPESYKDIGVKPSPDLLLHFRTAVARLTQVLDSTNEADDTRREAAFALGAIGDKSAVPVLTKYISSEDAYLAEISKEALLKLTALE